MADADRDRSEKDRWGWDWESHRKRQLVIGLAATPAQRLAWLAAMIELAWRTGALPRRRAEDSEQRGA